MSEIIVNVDPEDIPVVQITIDENSAQAAKDAAASIMFPDQVLKTGEVVITDLTAFIAAADFQWRLNRVEFLTAPEFTAEIDPATEGFNRSDIIEGDNTGNCHLKKGTEDEEAAPEPEVTPGRIRLAGIPIFGATVGVPDVAFVGDNFISKIEKGGWPDYDSTGDNAFIPAAPYGKGLLIVYNVGLNSVDGVDFSNVDEAYSGKEYIVFNRTGGSIVLNNLASVVTGQAKFHLQNELPLVVPHRGQVAFSNWQHTTLTQTWKNWDEVTPEDLDNIYTKSETDDLLALKLDASDYNQHFLGVYVTLAALNAAHPAASVGDYAQVNETGATDVVNYNWDNEDSIWVAGGGTGGAANTDALPEGSTNLYWTVARFLANLTYANVIAALGFTPSTAPNDAQKNSDITKAEIEAKLTGEITSHTHPGGGGDMVLASAQTNTGVKTFLNGTIGFRNVANTFTSLFTNANTAVRTYTLQNRDGTLADNTDLAGKMANPAGTANYLSKFLTATTIGLSRLWDTGTFLGIGTANTPTKDITLGNQANREIGIEESSNTVVGRDLSIRAGRAINYIPNANFNALGQTSRTWDGISGSPSGDVYAITGSAGVFKQTAGTGVFTSYAAENGQGITVAPNGDIYIISSSTVKKQTGGTGSFVTQTGSFGSNGWGITAAANGDIYSCAFGGDIYKQTGGTGSFVAIGGASRNWLDMASAPNGDNFAVVNAGDLYKQIGGTGSFVAVSTGLSCYTVTVAPNGNVYVGTSSQVYMQTSGSGSFVASGATVPSFGGMGAASSGNIYGTVNGGDIYLQQNNGTGTADLDGGTYKAIAGTGKGTGQSRFEIYTGQKLASGADMQTETLREYIDENGYHIYVSIPAYADDAAADADTNLPSGASYKITGNRTIFHKP